MRAAPLAFSPNYWTSRSRTHHKLRTHRDTLFNPCAREEEGRATSGGYLLQWFILVHCLVHADINAFLLYAGHTAYYYLT